MLMHHPFTFRIGGANITLTTNDESTFLTLHHSGIARQHCQGKFVAVGIDKFDDIDIIIITLLTTVGEREYIASVLEITQDGQLERHTTSLSTEKDHTHEEITISYDPVSKTTTVHSASDHNTIYKRVTHQPLEEQP